MASCADIISGLEGFVCGAPPIAGTSGRMILVNFNDIDKTLTTKTNNTFSTFVLKSGKKGYEFTTAEDSIVGEATLELGTYFGVYNHSLSKRVFVKSDEAQAYIQSLNGAKVVAIVQNNEIGENGKAKYQVYGYDAGLTLTELTNSTEMTDGVAYDLKIANNKSKEKALPYFIYSTSEATTDTLIAGLLTPAS